MPFVYRLQKILNYRIQKKDEQVEAVKLAEQEVARIQNEIDNHKNTISVLRQNMRSALHILMESYDLYIRHINNLVEQLEEEKIQAILKLQEEKEKLLELEKGVKVLEKHKEKAVEQYKEEEKRIEMKRLDEVAGLKHFAIAQERKQEEEEELNTLLAERLDIDEY